MLLNNSNYIGKNFLQVLLALASGFIISVIYLYFIFENCITIYEAMLPDRENFYSQIARFPVALPAAVFTIINVLIFMFSKKRYKVYAYSYLLLTVLITLASLLFIKTDQVHGGI
jgi:hypothetical protein